MLVVAGFALLGAPRDAHALLVLEGTITPTVAYTIPGDGLFAANTTIVVWATDGNVAYPGGTPASIGGGPVIQLTDTSDGTNGNISLAPGTIFTTSSGGYTVNNSASFDSKVSGGNTITSNAQEITNTSGGTVTTNIGAGDNGFVGPANLASFSASGTWTNAAGSVYNTFFYDDPTNVQPLQGPAGVNGTILGLLSPALTHTVVGTADSFGQAATAAVNDTGPFAMTLRFNFTLVNGGTFVSRGQNELKSGVVPEPGTIAMAISGLPVLGLLWGRRRRRQHA